jgi:hypothetical protein
MSLVALFFSYIKPSVPYRHGKSSYCRGAGHRKATAKLKCRANIVDFSRSLLKFLPVAQLEPEPAACERVESSPNKR